MNLINALYFEKIRREKQKQKNNSSGVLQAVGDPIYKHPLVSPPTKRAPDGQGLTLFWTFSAEPRGNVAAQLAYISQPSPSLNGVIIEAVSWSVLHFVVSLFFNQTETQCFQFIYLFSISIASHTLCLHSVI